MNEVATQRIVVVDDDTELRELVTTYLANSGYQVEGVGDGAAFRASMARQGADLVVLDLMLPGEDGLSLLKWLRTEGGPPVIIISARGEEVDRVVGLEVGADDYLAKPFGPRELLARVRAVLRRGNSSNTPAPKESDARVFGPFQLDVATHVLTRDGTEVPLTSGEFTLLRIFLEHPNQVLTRDHLITLVKGYERSPFDRSVDVRVTRLRRKIEPNPEAPIYLRTIWGRRETGRRASVSGQSAQFAVSPHRADRCDRLAGIPDRNGRGHVFQHHAAARATLGRRSGRLAGAVGADLGGTARRHAPRFRSGTETQPRHGSARCRHAPGR